ncbi:MAG: NrfD/PsrC family molybdoenzyme membrane anchor subunit, partial [Lutibacter sp.]|nr:NrfD/PsrC family molybdoenzyme membrane anchor subunit [Lutibacter sp.]
PDKGILWGWEVSAYVFTKAIAAGAFLIPFLAMLLGYEVSPTAKLWSAAISLVFLGLTGLFLVMDLDRPDRFLNVLLRPQWNSWLVKGGYTITVFGLLVTVWGAMIFFEIKTGETALLWITVIFAILLAIYTAFLFAQAKGRDFWQSPTLPLHMLVHSVMAGTAIFAIVSLVFGNEDWMQILKNTMIIALVVNLFTLVTELTITHPTTSAKMVVKMITKGRYKNLFWGVSVFIGNLIPLAILLSDSGELWAAVSGICVLAGILITEKIWVEAPQRVPLA